MAYRVFWEFVLFDFAMFYNSIIFSEPAHLIYYVLRLNHSSEPGSSDLLWFAHQ